MPSQWSVYLRSVRLIVAVLLNMRLAGALLTPSLLPGCSGSLAVSSN